ncbi:MAG TPA: hypothetical protein VK306_11475 [Acidimicrobiales bacterium]|nr:hypothetical protein [Acidimicrobiales bacterium]
MADPARGRDGIGWLSGDERDGLGMRVLSRPWLVELRLDGELDMATAPRLAEAVAWLRRGGRTVVVDTRGLVFVGVAGERALRAAVTGPDGGRDPQVLIVVGAAVGRLRRMLALAVRAGGAAGLTGHAAGHAGGAAGRTGRAASRPGPCS